MSATLQPTSGLAHKLRTFQRIYSTEGPRAVVRTSFIAVGKWWRQGEIWELRKSEHVRLGGCRFASDRRIAQQLRDLLATGLFEIHERNAIRRYVDGTLPVVEFGACIGVVACTTNQRLRDPKRHVVVEANPPLVEIIEENRRRNGCSFTVLNAVVGYGAGVTPFRVSDANPLESGTYCRTGRDIELPTVSLREIVRKYGFDRCVLICDIEGAEFDLITNESQALEKHVSLIILELHVRLLGEKRTDAILSTLRESQFQLLERVHETFVFRNARFV